MAELNACGALSLARGMRPGGERPLFRSGGRPDNGYPAHTVREVEGMSMKTLQGMFETALRRELAFHKVGARLIQDRLAQLGVSLNDEQLLEVESKLLNLRGDSITVSVDVEDISSIDSALEDGIDLRDCERDLEALLERFGASFERAIPAIVDEVSDLILDQLKRDAPEMLSSRKRQRQSFEADLATVWRKPLDLLEMIVAIAYEAGDDFNREHRGQATHANDHMFVALTRLHARACQIASEVLVLLRSGYADGAHARWRALHEVAVVASFIESGGGNVAERYIAHEAIESYKGARQYQDHCEALGFERIPDQEFREMESGYERLKERFGDKYAAQYGWAAPAFGGRSPHFDEIEKKVGLAHLRPFYKMASHNVHAGPKGIFFRMGLCPAGEPILLAGPSDAGLADPAQGMAITLAQITSTLLNSKATVDSLVVSRVLMKLADEVGRESVEVQSALESRAAAQQ